MRICFDMDGTIANFYGVANWLKYLEAEDTKPYEEATVLLNMSILARYLNKLQRMGHELVIISWTAKHGTPKYNEAVAEVKKAWLRKHLNSVEWDEINIVPYGFGKWNFAVDADDILFDDEAQNREAWTGKAYEPKNILEILKNI